MSATVAPAPPSAPPPAFPPGSMRRRRPRGRIVLLAVAAIVVLSLVAGSVFVVWQVRRPLPQTSGSLQLPGLGANVTVYRDDRGVPQIYAKTTDDLFKAQGYIQAQDRFFEMDYRRHVTSGRLAELVGDVPEAIKADKVVRTFGWRSVAAEEWGILSDSTKSYLTAYADGINAYLKSRTPAQIALEYTVLGMQVAVADPEPWSPIDSLAWLKAMAWDLRGNYNEELHRALAFGHLNMGQSSQLDAKRIQEAVRRVDELFPAYPDQANHPILDASSAPRDTARSTGWDFAVDLTSSDLQAAIDAADRALRIVPSLVGTGDATGSNSWVVSGQFTTTGSPMLANDPHLALTAPGVWAQIGLHCDQVTQTCPFDVAGFSFAGLPGVIIGHNADLAWGLTNMGADVTDFFIERIRGESYLRDGEWVPLVTRDETIRVNGAPNRILRVSSTVHGPIVSSVLQDTDAVRDAPTDDSKLGEYAVSLQWTALEPGRTADAIFAINLAASAADIRAAAALFDVPAQNIVFATVDGHIGYQAPGKIPIRKVIAPPPVPSDGTWPRPGWLSDFDWTGYIPASEMPRVLDPAEGFIVAANQAVLPSGFGPFLAYDWDYGYRSQRIRTLLTDEIAAGRKISPLTMSAIQLDDWSPFAAALVPTLLQQKLDHNPFAAQGQKLLAKWDYRMSADSAAAAYFAAVWHKVLELTFRDDLPESAWPTGGSRWLAVIQGLLANPNDPYWDDRGTVSVVESRNEVLTDALELARAELTVSLSKQVTDWRWGQLHVLALEHPVLGGEGVSSLVRNFFNPRRVGLPGGPSIVNANAWDASTDSFGVTAGPSMRMVVDLANLNESTWVSVTGTSGHPASGHYADQLDAWAHGRTFPWPFTRVAVQAAAGDTLVLTP